MAEEKIYELRKDVWTPAGYWRAGQKLSEEGWHKEFGFFTIKFCSEWFIEHPIKKEKRTERDELQKLIDKVFGRRNIHSITYKEAAFEVATLWLKQKENDTSSSNSNVAP